MGRMDDALRKAAEQRQQKRIHSRPAPVGETVTHERTPVGTPVAMPLADPPRPSTPFFEPQLRKKAGRPSQRAAAAPSISGVENVDERLVVHHDPRDMRSEQIRMLRTNLLALDPPPRTLLLTSALQAEGKSLVAVNLAAAFAEEEGKRVLIIDADLRNPSLHELLCSRRGPGLADHFQDEQVSLRSLIQETRVQNLDMISAGEQLENPGAHIVASALRSFLGQLPGGYDRIIIDSPPLEEVADATVMGPETDGVLLVVKLRNTPKAETRRAVEVLEAARARVLGAVATDVS